MITYKVIVTVLSISVLAWLLSVISQAVGLYHHGRYLKELERKYKLPKPDFYNPITGKMEQSYWQRINNIETK